MPTPLSSALAGPLSGRISVPGDKSISHRALLLGAMATGVTRISGLLEAEDVLNTAKVAAAMGAVVTREGKLWTVRGLGTGGLLQPQGDLDFGNSGTGCRLTMGVLAGHPIEATFTGDASLSRRPMGRVLTPLKQMGLEVVRGGDTLPLTLRGPAEPVPIVYESPVPSAQVKSAVLLAGLSAPGQTTVIEREPTRDHTERMFRHFGAGVEVAPHGKGQAITVTGEAELTGREVEVPADPSSAAFPAAAALIAEGSIVTVANVLVNPTRAGFYQTLREMGADVAFDNERERNGEPLADITVRWSRLKGITVPAGRAPSMIDEYPVLAAVAAFAEGETRMEGLGELRVKESDRLAATAAGLAACGVAARIEGDSLIVTGGKVKGGGHVATHMDHRIAMAFLVLGMGAQEPVGIDDGDMIATSFPDFVSLMNGLGANIATAEPGA